MGRGGGISGYYWPEDIRADDTVDAWIQLFSLFNFEVCDDADLEDGMEKIAIYADLEGEASHVARQLPSGEWTSKLNKLEDISHRTLDALLRIPEFVVIAKIMKRPRIG